MTTTDTNKILAGALEAAEAWEGAKPGSADERAAAERATGLLTELHHQLHEGGHLPAAWASALPPVTAGHNSGAY